MMLYFQRHCEYFSASLVYHLCILQRFAMILTRANHGFMTLAQPF
jgi:hypothetical protein